MPPRDYVDDDMMGRPSGNKMSWEGKKGEFTFGWGGDDGKGNTIEIVLNEDEETVEVEVETARRRVLEEVQADSVEELIDLLAAQVDEAFGNKGGALQEMIDAFGQENWGKDMWSSTTYGGDREGA